MYLFLSEPLKKMFIYHALSPFNTSYVFFKNNLQLRRGISSGDGMKSIVIMVNNTVFYSKMLRDYTLNVLTIRGKKDKYVT